MADKIGEVIGRAKLESLWARAEEVAVTALAEDERGRLSYADAVTALREVEALAKKARGGRQ